MSYRSPWEYVATFNAQRGAMSGLLDSAPKSACDIIADYNCQKDHGFMGNIHARRSSSFRCSAMTKRDSSWRNRAAREMGTDMTHAPLAF
jgi:hypothetical protein